MAYDKKHFRTVKHGLEDENAYCRHCVESFHEKGCAKKAYEHAKKTGHTVDVYREHWVEYTSFVKDIENNHHITVEQINKI